MKATTKMSFDDLVFEYEKDFQSRHYQRTGQEAYDFNIKIQKINIPDIVRQIMSEDSIETNYQRAAEVALADFVQDIIYDYDWVDDWHQEGRMGGWLTLITNDMVFVDGIRLGAPRKRIRDLRDIDERLRIRKREFIKEMESTDFWEVGPRDWSPRAKWKPRSDR
jgi:hypothetical protein